MENTYTAHHPWYYKLGGKTLYPKQIMLAVKKSGYRGYMQDDINRSDNRAEPERTEQLKKIRLKVIADLNKDLGIYRKYACDLRDERAGGVPKVSFCSDINMDMSLKHNHLYNDFAHLIYLDEIIVHQFDLFSSAGA